MAKFYQKKIRVKYIPDGILWHYEANFVSYIFWGKVLWGDEWLWGLGKSKKEAIEDLRNKKRLIQERKTEFVDV